MNQDKGDARQRRPDHRSTRTVEFVVPPGEHDQDAVMAYARLITDDRWLVTMGFEHYARLRRMPCMFCGALLADNRQWRRAGWVDRTDNSRPYSTDNSRPCCPRCNFGKFKMSAAEYVEHCARVTDHMRRSDA